jgi:hypothetical protein
MADYADKNQVNRLMDFVNSTEKWLDQHFSGSAPSPAVTRVVASFRQYLHRCRRQIGQRRLTIDEVDRCRKRIDRVNFVLWRAGRQRR